MRIEITDCSAQLNHIHCRLCQIVTATALIPVSNNISEVILKAFYLMGCSVSLFQKEKKKQISRDPEKWGVLGIVAL